MAAAAWWTAVSRSDAERAGRQAQIESLAAALAPSIESLMAQGELSTVRRMVVDIRRHCRLSECRIILPNGQILADADPSRITLHNVPASWPAGPLDEVSPGGDGQVRVRQSLLVPGRGGATMELGAESPHTSLAQSDLLAGLATIAVLSLAVTWLIYRRTRQGLMPMGLIRDALLSARSGEVNKEALMIAGAAAPEASAWNELMSELAAMQQRVSAEQAREAMGGRLDGRNDLSNACDALPHGLILLDDHGRVRYANGASAIFLQRSRDKLIGADFGELMKSADVMQAIRSALDGGTRQRRTIEVERQDDTGKSVFRFGIRPPRREDGGSLLVTIEDITQQSVAQSSRNTFVAHATHELRTPLANIRLYLETALEDGEDDPQTRARCLNVINQESRRLERMVGEMLSVAEIEAGSLKLNPDDVRMDRVFEDLQNDYAAPAADKNIHLIFELPPKLPVIQGDREKLLLALHNLLANAVKYTPSGGTVTVRVKEASDEATKRRSDEGNGSASSLPTANCQLPALFIEIIDTGIGIDEQEQPLIFERFYRSKDPRVGKITGTGLGLALAREVARLHGGEITLRSELNRGSTFILILPAIRKAA